MEIASDPTGLRAQSHKAAPHFRCQLQVVYPLVTHSFKLEAPMTSSLLGFHYLLEWLIEFRKILIFTYVRSFPRWLRW